ncbi:class II aldolase/adducin family protein [Acidaminobacter sp. JC074]|uniref:class II aldolase/adducin family protein n=1 Tax=Acidaminobacter sp. JC074 TaxID=2530199 RepID=UPI001F108B48|nr:class II aldolase/adducin family protein [Acidaminobacter sp. JC074]MCH4888115.1 class II aldolase/adducin family protein [Acidaminobacter sp. JC074]
MSLLDKKKQVIELSHALIKHGLIARTWGNVSIKVDDNHFLITPSGRAYESLSPEDVVLVTMKSLDYEGHIKPSSEKGIHSSVYELKPHVQCVIHTHQSYASALGATVLKEIPLDYTVPCASYALPGTKQLMNHVRVALGVSKHAVIMKYHGAVCFGQSPEETLKVAIDLEDMCKSYIHTYLDKTGDPYENAALALGGQLKEYHPPKLDEQFVSTPSLVAMSQLGIPLLPLLDDFAQLTGIKAPVVNQMSEIKDHPVTLVKGYGAYIQAEEDFEALKIVTQKAGLAYMTAALFGKVKPIHTFERILMRLVYKYKYSKQVGGAK